jgi:triosephosphate isomerase
VHVHIRSCLIALAGPDGADIARTKYRSCIGRGDRATVENAYVGGVLIGGASLRSADFDAVLRTLPGRA